jgi:hypothetical protein
MSHLMSFRFRSLDSCYICENAKSKAALFRFFFSLARREHLYVN